MGGGGGGGLILSEKVNKFNKFGSLNKWIRLTKNWENGSWPPPKVIRYERVVLDTPLFRIWYSFVTKVKKEAPNRMKISHCIKVLHRVFPRIWPHLQTGFFPSAIWTPLGGCVRKVFGTILNNSKQVNASGTNSVKYFIWFATLLHLLVFV